MAATSRVEEAIEEVKRTRYVPAYSALDQYVAEMAARESQQQGRADTEAPAGPALQPEARKVQCYVKGDRLQQKVGCCESTSLRAFSRQVGPPPL